MFHFSPIDVQAQRNKIISFRLDAASISGKPDSLSTDAVLNNYLSDIRERVIADPQSCVHVLMNEEMIGQIELRILNNGKGLINLLYLVEGWRGKGVGGLMEKYAETYFRKNRIATGTLRVARINHRALEFYKNKSWVQQDAPSDGLIAMEKTYSDRCSDR